MKASDFIHQLDEARIVAAITEAERRTSGEIRVFVSHRHRDKDTMERAKERFAKLGMAETRDRNAVLLYFAPRDQALAIVGDQGIHEKCGEEFWQAVTHELEEEFKRGNFSDAVVAAIGKTGELLARHFPIRPDDEDELPNAILRD